MTLLYTSFIFLAASALISLPDSKNPNSPEMADVEHSVPCSDKKKRKKKKKKKKSKNKGLEDKEIETIQKPQSFTPCTDTSHWPLLLKNYDLLNVRTAHCAPFPPGFAPLKRPLPEFIRFGIINLDKPPHPSSDGVPAWTKRILRVQKTAHSETLDPKVSGNLNESIEESAKSQRDAGIEYVCTARLHSTVLDVAKIARVLEILTGPVFQRLPLISAVKGQLRVRYIYESKLVEYDADKHLVVFRITCEAGTYVSILCVHLGLLLGVGGHMQKLRKARLGIPTLAASTEPVNSEEQDDDSLIASFAASTESVNSEEQDDDSLIASLAASTEPVNLEEQNDDSLIASLAASTESVNSEEQDDSLIASLPASTEPVKWEDMVVEEEEKNKLMAEHGKPNENTPSEWIGNVHLSEVSDSLIPSLAASTKHVSWADMVEEEEEMNKLIAEHGKPNENTPSEWVGNVHLSEVSDFCLAASTEPVSWEDIVEEEEEMNKLIAEHGKPNENTPSENVPHPEVSDSLIASLAASTESVSWEDMVLEEEEKNKQMAEHGKPKEKTPSENVPHPEVSDSLIPCLAASTESVSWEDMVLEEEEMNKLIAEHGKPNENTPSEWTGNVHLPEISDSLIPSLAASTEPVSWADMAEEEEEMNKLIAEHGKPNENTQSENVLHPEVSDSLIPSLAASTKPVSWADMAEEEEEKNKLIAQHGKPNENTPSENVPHSEVSDSLIVCRALLQMNP